MASVHYHVAMPQPANHLFEVTIEIGDWCEPILDLYLPVWTPGSYLVREYAKHVQEFQVEGAGQGLDWCKQAKNHWRIQTASISNLTIFYRVLANDLTVRTNHLDLTHGYFNPAALLMYGVGLTQQPLQVTIVPPVDTWQVATPLEALPEQSHSFIAADYDSLVDSPFEVGLHQRYEFEVLGKPHQWVVWGQGNLKPERLIEDTRQIIETEAALFGGLPYDRYLFLLHLSANGYGGLEHKTSCSLLYPRFNFREPEQYQRFLQLVAHEFFHLWNVKRIRPKALETFDYNQENYTEALWFCEGVTSYYDLLIPQRAGLYCSTTFLEVLSKDLTRLQTTPGRLIQPLSESSFDTWIKLYRRHALSDNCQISYYLKGTFITFLLDLLIRQRHRNRRSFDDVLRQLWQQFGLGQQDLGQQDLGQPEVGHPEIGYTDAQLQGVIEAVAEIPLDDFFSRYLYGTEELPFNQFLQPFGLVLQSSADPIPYLGLTIKSEPNQAVVKFVAIDSPSQKVGVEPGDVLLAIDGIMVTAEGLNDRLKDYKPGQTIAMTLFHGDELRTYDLTLVPSPPKQYRIVTLENPNLEQQKLLQGWLGDSP
jgi:predicted metalloprotease with PDZ domain